MSSRDDCFQNLIRFTGKNYFLTCAYARNCFYLLLKALGIGKDDEVIVPAYSCLSIYKAIEEVGAIPIYVDCDEGSMNISPEKIKLAIGIHTKLIYVIHAYGIVARIDEIFSIANDRAIWLVEDISHTLNAQYKGRPAGSYGHFTIFSLTKLFLNYQGAIITTNDKVVFDRMKRLQAGYPTAPKRLAYLPNYMFRLLGASYERDASLMALLLFKIVNLLLNVMKIKRESASDFDYNFFHMSSLAVRLFVLSYKKYLRLITPPFTYDRFRTICIRFMEFPHISEFQSGTRPNYMAACIRGHQQLCKWLSLSTWHNVHQPGLYKNADRIYDELRIFPKFFAKAVSFFDRHRN